MTHVPDVRYTRKTVPIDPKDIIPGTKIIHRYATPDVTHTRKTVPMNKPARWPGGDHHVPTHASHGLGVASAATHDRKSTEKKKVVVVNRFGSCTAPPAKLVQVMLKH